MFLGSISPYFIEVFVSLHERYWSVGFPSYNDLVRLCSQGFVGFIKQSVMETYFMAQHKVYLGEHSMYT